MRIKVPPSSLENMSDQETFPPYRTDQMTTSSWGNYQRSRTSNWSEGEVAALVDTYYNRRDIMRTVRHGGDPKISVQEREQAWKEIYAAVINSSDGHTWRTPVQIKKKWENILFRHKSIIIEYKKKFKEGSEGPPPLLDETSTKIWDVYGMDNPMFKVEDENTVERPSSGSALAGADTSSLADTPQSPAPHQEDENSGSTSSHQVAPLNTIHTYTPTEQISPRPRQMIYYRNKTPSQPRNTKTTARVEHFDNSRPRVEMDATKRRGRTRI